MKELDYHWDEYIYRPKMINTKYTGMRVSQCSIVLSKSFRRLLKEKFGQRISVTFNPKGDSITVRSAVKPDGAKIAWQIKKSILKNIPYDRYIVHEVFEDKVVLLRNDVK